MKTDVKKTDLQVGTKEQSHCEAKGLYRNYGVTTDTEYLQRCQTTPKKQSLQFFF